MKLLFLLLFYFIFNLTTQAQSTPFGEIEFIPKDFKVWHTLIPANGRLYFFPYSTDIPITIYQGTNKTYITNNPGGIIRFGGVFKNGPLIISDPKSTLTWFKEKQFLSVSLPESILDAVITDSEVSLLLYDQNRKTPTIATSLDMLFFRRFALPFSSTGKLGEINHFKLDNWFYFTVENLGRREIYRSRDLISFDKLPTSITNAVEIFTFNKRYIMVDSNGFLSTVGDDFLSSNHLGIYADKDSFITTDNLIFCSDLQRKVVHYSRDATNWASIHLKDIHILNSQQKPLAISGNYLFTAGEVDSFYKVGPILSPDGLNIKSELVHAVKIRGSVGQQVEILASDEVDGEYTPLQVITLTSTEYIYNDNRLNKPKQYYKFK
jgi:hypothetical protein